MPRTALFLAALALLLALGVHAHAEDEKKDGEKRTLLRRVMDALASEDKDAMKKLVRKDHVDAWMLVDELLGLKEVHAADVYAAHAAALRADYAQLPAYTAKYVAQAEETNNRAIFAEVVAAVRKRDLDALDSAVKLADLGRDEVMAVRIEHAYGMALFAAGKGRKSAGRFASAAARAQRIGWMRLAADGFMRGAEALVKAGDDAGARKLATKRLEVATARKKSLDLALAHRDLARIELRTGDFEEAAENARLAAARFGFHENKAELAASLSLAGVALRRKGDLKQALSVGTKACEVADRLKDDHLKGVTAYNLAATQEALGADAKAIQLYERAARLLHEKDALAAQARRRQAALQKDKPK